ncbi:hypothetical protein BD769DRAFT_1397901 [Suillus cothurnatus]|nr:hypothetical protein BD769DRAFT_1397901 [Suillus cothurnatus]
MESEELGDRKTSEATACSTIARDMGNSYPEDMIATTIAAFALSSVLTWLSFLFDYLRFGVLVWFFPRYILVGCIGEGMLLSIVVIIFNVSSLTGTKRLPSNVLVPPTLETIRLFSISCIRLGTFLRYACPVIIWMLSVSLDVEIDTNKERLANWYLDLVDGFLGTAPNYHVYKNTLLVGGGTRIAGLLLAVATFILLMIGTGLISDVPIMVVSALILVLGIDIIKEALWDTRHWVSRSALRHRCDMQQLINTFRDDDGLGFCQGSLLRSTELAEKEYTWMLYWIFGSFHTRISLTKHVLGHLTGYYLTADCFAYIRRQLTSTLQKSPGHKPFWDTLQEIDVATSTEAPVAVFRFLLEDGSIPMFLDCLEPARSDTFVLSRLLWVIARK